MLLFSKHEATEGHWTAEGFNEIIDVDTVKNPVRLNAVMKKIKLYKDSVTNKKLTDDTTKQSLALIIKQKSSKQF